MKRLGTVFLVVAITVLSGAEIFHARAQSPAGVVTTLHGSAQLTRASAAQPLRFRDDLFLQDRIDTREESLVRVLLGGKALVTVRELSSLTISEQPGRAIVDLRNGRVGVEVAPRLMRSGDAIEIRTPNAIAAVRGSFVVVEVTGPEASPKTDIVTRTVTLPVEVSWGNGGTALSSDHTMVIAGSGASLRVTPLRPLTAVERARADAVRQIPREPSHSESLPEPLEIAADEEAEKAHEELEELGGGGEGDGEARALGLNEIAAARLAALFGATPGEPAGLTPEPPPWGPALPAPPGPGGPGAPPFVPPPPPAGPPVVPQPPAGPPAGGPGFSELSNGSSTHSHASPTGGMPPAAGLGGGAPPGLAKKR